MAEYRIETGEQVYIPKWDGNQEKDDPIKAHLTWLKTGQRAQCYEGVVDDDGTVRHKVNYRRLVQFGLKRLEGFRVNGKDVETPEEFLATPGFDILLMELGVEILNMNPIVDRGN